MIIIPAIVIALGGVTGASGIALTVKSAADMIGVSNANRQVQMENEKNLLEFEACSEQLSNRLQDLGKQRLIISRNFSAFTKAFEKIHNRPEFTAIQNDAFPSFDFEKIKGVSVVADTFIGAAAGAVSGSIMAAAAASGTTAAMMALGTASTGTKIAELSGAAATKAALAALGGGAIKVGGGGIALGTIVLNCASLGIATLFEGLALSYTGSVMKKQADKMKKTAAENKTLIGNAMDLQWKVIDLAQKIQNVSVEMNGIYGKLVKKLKDLVNRKADWNTYTEEEKLLVENNILIVQILYYLNSTPLYIVSKTNEKGEVEETEVNQFGVNDAISNAKKGVEKLTKD